MIGILSFAPFPTRRLKLKLKSRTNGHLREGEDAKPQRTCIHIIAVVCFSGKKKFFLKKKDLKFFIF